MSERGVLRRSESPALLPALAPLAACVAVALVLVLGVDFVRAQGEALSPADSLRLADSLRVADSTHVADSTAFADSVAEADAEAEAGGTFGNNRSILDRSRQGGPVIYNSGYSVNRSNRNWSQGIDIYTQRGRLEFANVTNASVGREARVGRVNRNSQTQNELAYRVSRALRLGGRLGIQRVSDNAQSRNFTSTRSNVDDFSGQVRFNSNLGAFPLRSVASYGYLRNNQSTQQSKGTSFDFYASTSRTWGSGSNVNFDITQQASRLRSTVIDDPTFQQDDRNLNTNIHVASNIHVSRMFSADARLSSQRSVLRRPARVALDPLSDSLTTLREKIDGVNDDGALGLHFSLPQATTLNLGGTIARSRQVYTAEADRSSLVDRRGVTADFRRVQFGVNTSIRYDESVTDNDYTRRDPGYVESNLQRRLDGDLARKLSMKSDARLSLGVYLSRRSYVDFRSAQPTAVAPSNQDQLRVRGSLNLLYKATKSFDTGVTFAIEQSDLVNIKSTSSINNARLRTYSVAWNWNARPGSMWNVTQSNSATAAQQFFTFSSDRDQLSFIYNINTNIQTQLSQKLRLDLNHIIRLQSRGSFRQISDVRRFGKSSEFNTFDLLLREQYQANSILSLEISQRLAVNPNFQFADGRSTKINETRRDELTFLARMTYPMSKRAGLNGDVRRVLATDRQRSFGVTPTNSSTNSDYWLATLSFRMEFQP
ncbi:MAG: hypothetical protein ABI960_11000 [Candidatus Eisenbacteria bacterium]